MFRALCAHHQEVKIVLYSIWYHHTYRWPSGAQVERFLSQPVHGTKQIHALYKTERLLFLRELSVLRMCVVRNTLVHCVGKMQSVLTLQHVVCIITATRGGGN